ncbi:hypothetical protein Pint_24958 [Pistacia integerrima]|uniref:Uncharacterized protein n=1 Tax=Pistacia integerrima TaxID=434235 RepID=A0ACC0YEW9_9ROSI|nr:hypothetical protein Pint_24958 [Pistacia integerrima]
MGDSEVDVDNPVLKEEQMPSSVVHNHVDKSTFCRLVKRSRGDVTITISSKVGERYCNEGHLCWF